MTRDDCDDEEGLGMTGMTRDDYGCLGMTRDEWDD